VDPASVRYVRHHAAHAASAGLAGPPTKLDDLGDDVQEAISQGSFWRMSKTVVVVHSSCNRMVLEAAPEDATTFTMKDFAFEMPGTLPAGKATYKVVNAGPQPHELGVLKLAPGKTDEDVLAWDSAPSGPPPFESVGGINAFSADGSGYMTLDLAPGEYLAVCHIPDPVSGVAHLHLGMTRHFTVAG